MLPLLSVLLSYLFLAISLLYFSGILAEASLNGIHMAMSSTWSHVGTVVEIGYATPKQTPQTAATPKRSRPQLPSCGVP
ncbi:MAG: hypothetical protein M1540_01700 [Candidatus Bathyarchaeota archaeon]|nr:hypothetical protein [Candidatus Bathyarchaeota archaeon]